MVRKTLTHSQAVAVLAQLERLVTVVAVDAAAAQQALTGGFPDFEDALHYFAAAAVPAIEALATRDPRGFRGSRLPVLTPAEAARR